MPSNAGYLSFQQASAHSTDIHTALPDPQRHPGSARFELARSYEARQQFHEARQQYDWCATTSNDEEEAWYAAYRLGLCSIELDDWDLAVAQLLRAWERRPERAEPLYHLARQARLRGDPHLAMLAAERARRIPLPTDDPRFVEMPAYDYGPLEEISISAYYTGELEMGMAAIDTLVHRRDVPGPVRELAGNNAAYYVRPLPAAWSAPIELTADFGNPSYAPGNGTIWRDERGYLVVVRLRNYDRRDTIWSVSRDPDGHVRSKNGYLRLDHALNIESSGEIDCSLVERLRPPSRWLIQGIEDLRVIRWENAWWFIACSCSFTPTGDPGLVLGRFDDSVSCVEYLVPLTYARSRTQEKNWTPFIHENQLLLIYSYDPLVILEPDLETGICREVQRTTPELNCTRYRGSSAVVPYGERYLFTIHEVPFVQGRRAYLHRFVEMDRQLRITRVSRLFNFWHLGDEYNCGICLNHAGDALLLTCSYEDRQARIARLPLSQLEQMLLPVTALLQADCALGRGIVEQQALPGIEQPGLETFG